MSAARTAYDRVQRGELELTAYERGPRLTAGAAADLGADLTAAAWDLAAHAARERYTGARTVTPDAVRCFTAAPAEARLGATAAAAEAVRSAALAFDLDAVDAHASALHAVAPDHPDAHAQRQAAQLWCALAHARWEDAAARAVALEAQAAALASPSLVVEAASLRALALSALDLLDEATKVARRASRMARTEGLPQGEYLAHWVLARVRRRAGAPHLATRILASLRSVAPPAWWPVLAWEAVLSGITSESRADSGADQGHAPHPAPVLVEWVLGLERGDGPGFAVRTAQLLAAAAPWPAHRAEVEAWIAAVDPTRTPTADVAPWSSGRTAIAPPALAGLLGWRGVAPAGDSAVAYVLVDGPLRRRLPRLSFALLDRDRIASTAQSRLKQGRTEMLAAALALAPPAGLDEASCFASVYGFPYEPEVHKSIFDVLVHRAREHLAGRATLARGGGRLALTVGGPLLLADPRCTRPFGDALLGVLAEAERAGASAKEVAQATGASLRVVQATLQSLVEDGACQQARGGREVRYRVEDTTYSEPTQRVRLGL